MNHILKLLWTIMGICIFFSYFPTGSKAFFHFEMGFSFLLLFLFLIKEARIYNGEKTASSISGAGKTGQLHVKE